MLEDLRRMASRVLHYVQRAELAGDGERDSDVAAFTYRPDRYLTRMDESGRLKVDPDAPFTATKIDTPYPPLVQASIDRYTERLDTQNNA